MKTFHIYFETNYLMKLEIKRKMSSFGVDISFENAIIA